MKSKQQKYDEAVQRNLKNLKKVISDKFGEHGRGPVTLEKVKDIIGIRKSDENYDSQIVAMIPVTKKEKVAITSAT